MQMQINSVHHFGRLSDEETAHNEGFAGANGEQYWYQVETDSEGDISITDTVGRSIPIDYEHLGELLECLMLAFAAKQIVTKVYDSADYILTQELDAANALISGLFSNRASQ